MAKPKIPLSLILLTTVSPFLNSISAIDFLFNGFKPTDLLLYSNATVESSILTLTKDTKFAVGRALFPSKIRTKSPKSSLVLPFSTSFIFSMAPFRNRHPGHGIVLIFVPSKGIDGTTSAQNLGFLNRTNNGSPSNHILGIEFDVFENQEYGDINANHVGINVNSLTSRNASDAGYWVETDEGDGENNNSMAFKELKLNSGENFQVWVDYSDFRIKVSMAPAGKRRPRRPLLDAPTNLSDVFLEEMYVGFTAATGRMVEGHKVLGWSFSNSNTSLGDALITHNLPSFVLPEEPSIFRSVGFIVGVVVGVLVAIALFSGVTLFMVKKKQRRQREGMEEWELEYWPHRIDYREIDAATSGFSEENVIGIGGNGKVYRGVLNGGANVAAKCISPENGDGMREFLAEISSIGRLKHRNLVGLRGWCKWESGKFLLAYDYMENGSLDKRVFGCRENEMLGFGDRIRVLKDVARGLFYLHDGWEARVLHRDIKASNVLLDKEMNAKLGDFGLARIHARGEVPTTTRVVGTVGYLAPEVVRTGRVSTATDVFGFGVLVLEVMCGRRPIEEGKPPLVEWAWNLMVRGELLDALDQRLRAEGGFDKEEAERVLHLGLLCGYPDPGARPNMRQVVKILENNKVGTEDLESGDMELSLLGKSKSKEMWAKYHFPGFGRGHLHPTLKEVQESITSSVSLSWSDIVVEGR